MKVHSYIIPKLIIVKSTFLNFLHSSPYLQYLSLKFAHTVASTFRRSKVFLQIQFEIVNFSSVFQESFMYLYKFTCKYVTIITAYMMSF